MNLLKGKLERRDDELGVRLDEGDHLRLPGRVVAPPDGTPVSVGIRPEHAEPGPGALEVTVATTEMLGSETLVHAVTRSGDSFTYSRRGISRAVPGDRLRIDFPEPFVHLFDASGLTIGARPNWRDAYLT